MTDRAPRVVAGYIRVSTTVQADDGMSLGMQEQAIRAYCAAQSWPEPIIYSDAGRSAHKESPGARPAFARLLADAEAGAVNAIVVAHLNRWSRRTRLTLDTIQRLNDAGVALISLAQNLDYSSPVGKLTITVLAGIAQMESDEKAENAARVHAQLRAEGKWSGGTAPYGATITGELLLALDPCRAPVLERLLTMAATESAHAIAERFTREGIPAPGSGRQFHDRAARIWWPKTVREIVINGAWLLDQPEPWPTLWRAAIARPLKPRVRNDRPTHMLTALLRCRCGGPVGYGGVETYHAKRGERVLTLRCRANQLRPGGAHCPYKRRYALHYESIVSRAIMALRPRTAGEIPPDSTEADLTELLAERERIREAHQRGWYKPGEFARVADDVDARIEAAARRAPLRQGPDPAIGEALRTFDAIDPALQNEIARTLIERVVIAGDECAIIWRAETLRNWHVAA